VESPAFFEKKEKGEELTKVGTRTRHPLPSGRTITRGAARTYSSSGGTMTAGARNFSSSVGTSSSSGTMTEEPCRTGTPSSSGRTAVGGPAGILPLAGISGGLAGLQR
jgi:hypothetical protein